MEWYFCTALIAAATSLLIFAMQALRLAKLGKPKDLSKKSGNVRRAVRYSFIGAMSPTQKESAFLHLPTYTAGILYHIGSFAMLLLFLWFIAITFFDFKWFPGFFRWLFIAVLALSSISGIAILVKRLVKEDLKYLSTPDDYLSNIVTTVAQIASLVLLLNSFTGKGVLIFYCLAMAVFFLWLPIGKTRHALYFFFARYHLGFFYGWRGSWPIKTEKP